MKTLLKLWRKTYYKNFTVSQLNQNGFSMCSKCFTDATKLAKQLEEVKYVYDLRDPGLFFSTARSMKRHVIFHAGPTNSGKTYTAMQSFLKATSGIYCGPLRMLASEIYRKTSKQGVPCDMITGEERIYAYSELERASHVACTVELCATKEQYEVALIDEIQMIGNSERGWAWSRALLGIPAKEIHVCGEAAAINIVKKVLENTNDTFEVRHYERLTPLKILNQSVDNFKKIRQGDCIIAFSQGKIYDFRNLVEKHKNLKCAVIYGNLPSNVRIDQAQQFNSNQCDVLIASDAIGMGINLNIKRIIFSSLKKYNGKQTMSLTPGHTKQIAGRAGRYGMKYETGYVTVFNDFDMTELHDLLNDQNQDEVTKAGILPSSEQLELMSLALPGKDLLDLITIFELLMKLNKNYFLCDVESLKNVLRIIQDYPLSIPQSFTFATAPMNLKSDLVIYVMKMYAQYVCSGKSITKTDIRKLISWQSDFKPYSISGLQRFEFIHESLDLYLWLSFRFPDVFVDREGIVELQVEVEEIISRAVDTNLYRKNLKKHNQMKKRLL